MILYLFLKLVAGSVDSIADSKAGSADSEADTAGSKY
jgi:hypothetical protein